MSEQAVSGPTEPLLISRKAAAVALGLSLTAVDCLIRTGRLAATRIGRRTMVQNGSLHALATKGSAYVIRPR